ncbi:hypothetical protein JD969_09855 [Planctomycetota bacterium]|nr:hypothetical protein JD969_09855 [Planctomycetota bacterium]
MLIAELIIAIVELPVLIASIVGLLVELAAAVATLLANLLVWGLMLIDKKRAKQVSAVVKEKVSVGAGGEVKGEDVKRKEKGAGLLEFLKRVKGSKWYRYYKVTMLVLLGGVVVLVVLLNTVLFEPTVRYAIGKAAEKMGATIEVDTIEGSLLKGELIAEGVKFKRAGHEYQDFDLAIDELRFDVAMWDLLHLSKRIEHAEAAGVRGVITQNKKKSFEEKLARAMRKKSKVVIDELVVRDSEIEWRGDQTVRLDVDRFVSSPMRSWRLKRDFLFNSNGEIDLGFGEEDEATDGTLAVKREMVNGKQANYCEAVISGESFGKLIGGPMEGIREGEARLDLQTKWKDDNQVVAAMNWKVELKDIVAERTTDDLLKGWGSAATTKWLNSKDGNHVLSLTYDYKDERLGGNVGEWIEDQLKQLLDAMIDEMVGKVSEVKEGAKDKLLDVKDGVKEKAKGMKEKMKGLLGQ